MGTRGLPCHLCSWPGLNTRYRAGIESDTVLWLYRLADLDKRKILKTFLDLTPAPGWCWPIFGKWAPQIFNSHFKERNWLYKRWHNKLAAPWKASDSPENYEIRYYPVRVKNSKISVICQIWICRCFICWMFYPNDGNRKNTCAPSSLFLDGNHHISYQRFLSHLNQAPSID